MIDINWKPGPRELRVFSAVFVLFAGGGGGLVWWRGGPPALSWALWGAGLVVGLLGALAPRAVRPVFVGLSLLAFPIGWVIGNLLMAVVYYLVVTPVGLAFKVLGKDPMRRRPDPEAESYWIARGPAVGPERYFRQF